MAQAYAVGTVQDPADLPARCRFVILAVKPQDARAAIIAMAPSVSESNIIISIMAGVTTSPSCPFRGPQSSKGHAEHLRHHRGGSPRHSPERPFSPDESDACAL